MNALTDEIAAFRADAVLGPFAAAQAAVSRLDERARHSPWRDAWMQRVLFHEACACQLMEGDLVHLEDVVLLDGNAFSGAPSMALSSALEVLRIWRAAEAGEAGNALRAARPGLAGAAPLPESGEASDLGAPALNRAHLEAWHRIEAESRKQPPLLAAAMAWDAWLELLPESRSSWRATLLAALSLKCRGLTPNLLLPLAVGCRVLKYRRRPGQNLTTRVAGFLAWAEAAAAEGQKEFDSLVLAEKLLRSSLRGRRSNSRMPQLVELLRERPFVSVALASRALRISRQAAHTMLKKVGAPVHRPQTLQRLERDGLGGPERKNAGARRGRRKHCRGGVVERRIRVEFNAEGAEHAPILQAKIDAAAIFLEAAVYGFNVIGLEGKGDGDTFLKGGCPGLAHEMKDMEQGRRHG